MCVDNGDGQVSWVGSTAVQVVVVLRQQVHVMEHEAGVVVTLQRLQHADVQQVPFVEDPGWVLSWFVLYSMCET